MMLSLRRLLLPIVLAASLAAIGAAGIAAKEIAAQDYVRHGLWRTVTWVLAHHTLVGAAAGTAAGLLTILVLVCRLLARSLLRSHAPSEQEQPPAEAVLELAPRLALILTACGTAVAVVAPTAGPTRLGVPYELAAGACLLLLLWVATSASAPLAGSPADDPPAGWIGSVWPVVVGSGYIVAFLHFWAHTEDARRMVILTSVAFVAALLAYHTLEGPARSLVSRLSRIIGRTVHLARAARAAVAVLGGGAVLWTAGWVVGLRARAQAHEAGPNVIIIAVDTLRWDAVSLLSEREHERDLTPNLRRLLASRGVVFSNATSQAPWTLPAFASIFTGLYPEEHGAQHFVSRLSPDQLTLAELMREAGYSTMSVVSGHYVTSEVGMTQGFARWDESQAISGATISSELVTDRALAMLADHRDDRFFLFAHYFDPHHPYMDHPEFAFTISSGDRALTAPSGVGGLRLATARVLYAEEVAFTDLHIGRLLRFLEEAKLWESTCVILVADHGEEFLEHGSRGHDRTLFQELVHVPLAIVDPAREAPAVVTRPVETRQLFDTILGIVGVRAPLRREPAGAVLAAVDSDERQVRSSTRPMPDEAGEHSTRVWLSCLSDGRYKFIRDYVADSVMLFDLLEDPGETRDVSADQPEDANRLDEALAALDAEVSKGASNRRLPKPTEEQLRRVRDLGYL